MGLFSWWQIDDIFFSYFSQKIGSDILYKLSPSLEEMSNLFSGKNKKSQNIFCWNFLPSMQCVKGLIFKVPKLRQTTVHFLKIIFQRK